MRVFRNTSATIGQNFCSSASNAGAGTTGERGLRPPIGMHPFPRLNRNADTCCLHIRRLEKEKATFGNDLQYIRTASNARSKIGDDLHLLALVQSGNLFWEVVNPADPRHRAFGCLILTENVDIDDLAALTKNSSGSTARPPLPPSRMMKYRLTKLHRHLESFSSVPYLRPISERPHYETNEKVILPPKFPTIELLVTCRGHVSNLHFRSLPALWFCCGSAHFTESDTAQRGLFQHVGPLSLSPTSLLVAPITLLDC